MKNKKKDLRRCQGCDRMLPTYIGFARRVATIEFKLAGEKDGGGGMGPFWNESCAYQPILLSFAKMGNWSALLNVCFPEGQGTIDATVQPDSLHRQSYLNRG
jgi:hypothetical protein